MASSAAPTSTTDQLQEVLSERKTNPAALGNMDNMLTNTTESSPQPKEDIPQVSFGTENTLLDPVDMISEAVGGNLGETSGQGSSSVRKRPADKVKSVDVGILLQTIESQQELQKTFEKQLEVAKNQLEVLHEILRGLGGAEKIEKSAATTESPKKLCVRWDPEEVENWQRGTIPTPQKLENMWKIFVAKDTSGSFYASNTFPHIAFTRTNGSELYETPWPEKGDTEQGKFLEKIKHSWPQNLVEGDQYDDTEWLGGIKYPVRDDWTVLRCDYHESGLLKIRNWQEVCTSLGE
jgi:hypothetical protein